MVEEEQNIVLRNALPLDASVIKEIGSWAFFFSKSTSSLYVVTTDYHAGPRKLSMEHLSELMAIVKQHRDKLTQNIEKDLEAHLASIIDNEKDKEIFRGAKVKLIPLGE